MHRLFARQTPTHQTSIAHHKRTIRPNQGRGTNSPPVPVQDPNNRQQFGSHYGATRALLGCL
eukprot:3965648-Amphidinium_carterae.1